MQILIDIPENMYLKFKDDLIGTDDVEIIAKSIINGTPLPKGHGKLIDVSNLLKEIEDNIPGNYLDLNDWVLDSPIIIEADRENEDAH